MRVLIADDSVVFRSQIKSAITGVSGIEVVGVANDGKIALAKLAQSTVDLIVLDLEMPVMGGLETIKEIKKLKFTTKIIVFSSHSRSGSDATIDALASGADDFVTKPIGDEGGFEKVAERIKSQLIPKILQFKPTIMAPLPSSVIPGLGQSTAKVAYIKRDLQTFNPTAIVIGSSTGGPPALEKILVGLSLPFRLPIFITQHMPPFFTASLAKRLKEASGIEAHEGREGETVLPNHIYVAPGDYHMSVVQDGADVKIKLDKGPERNSVRPAVDILFESASRVYKNRTMSVILTGMGEDGLIGVRAVKQAGGGVMIQSKESCVVFGMPGAVFLDGSYDEIGGLGRIQSLIRKMGA